MNAVDRTVRRHRKKIVALCIVLLVPIVLHLSVGLLVRFTPSPVTTAPLTMREEAGVRRAGAGWSVMLGDLRLIALAGTPEEIGTQHPTLVWDRMALNEEVLWSGLETMVPVPPLRTLLFDIARMQYRHVDRGFPDARRRELSAQARAFTPDPYEKHLPTYTRMVFLHSLYDIALGFEHSPLLGCSAFGLGPDMTADGHALFARVFDFEAADVFDRDKAVFFVRETGKLPFVSVAWPGFVGVVTGMNAEGVAIAVHGGRAREPSTEGIPVAFAIRDVLQNAHDTAEATALLAKQPVMVSHIVFVGDAKGSYAVVERAPGVPAHVVPGRTAVTNHFEGPLAADPRNERVRATTTTLPRRARLDELLRDAKSATVPSAIAMLRDHRCAGGESCGLGDRRTIDAFIATHGVVADLTAKALWVSEGPHLSGRFVKIDVAELVATGQPPRNGLDVIPVDAVLGNGGYEEGRARAGGPLLKEGRKR